MIALADAVRPTRARPSGALAECEVLTLADNKISMTGVDALAKACTDGALPSMKRFLLVNNVTNNPGIPGPVVQALCDAKSRSLSPKATISQ